MHKLGTVLCAVVCSVGTLSCGEEPVPESEGGDATSALLADHVVDSAASRAFRNAVNTPPPGWSGHVFELSHAYPTQKPAAPAGGYPWKVHDFKTDPDGYMQAVLNYARADLEALDWDPTKMTTPTWFHTPWMASGPPSGSGREFIRGLTKERPSRPGELSPIQTNAYIPNYAVGFYNDMGGWTFGQV
ncbi:MAG: hypothetical protein DHS20C15_25530 [Planctomycetota bacterium]|nr:MAG: hypothetical protein DHS20C15_25530 [Planctomycetota bacterium]